MRELKFRAWDTALSIWARFVQLKSNGGITRPWEEGEDIACGRMVVEQFTGLHDKNGREIYEGDIVDSSYHNYDVFVGDGAFEVHMGVGGDSDGYNHGGWYGWKAGENSLLDVAEEATIIGNIHDNPELVNEKG